MTQATTTTTIRSLTAAPATSRDVAAPSGSAAGRVLAGVRRAVALLASALTGFGFLRRILAAPENRRTHGRGEELVVYTVHRSFYLWFLILAGFVSAACVNHWPGSATAWGWVY